LVLLTPILISISCGIYSIYSSQKKDALLPVSKSALPLTVTAEADKFEIAGESEIAINHAASSLDYHYTLIPTVDYPYASIMLTFGESLDAASYNNFSDYKQITFNIACSHEHDMKLYLITHEEGYSNIADIKSHRPSAKHFLCSQEQRTIVLDLDTFQTEKWWLHHHGQQMTDKTHTQINVKISDVVLHKKQNAVLTSILMLLTLCSWIPFIFWLSRQNRKTRIQETVAEIEIKAKDDKNNHKKATTPRKKNSDISKKIVQIILSNYPDPEFNIEALSTKSGLHRNRINDALKQKTGHTFSVYLNKLRLTEAARLLREEETGNITRVALAVGYKNVSYFCKVFKSSYGRSPKAYKAHNDSLTR